MNIVEKTSNAKRDLLKEIKKAIHQDGLEANLNHLDVSQIEDFSYLFNELHNFNGDISEWDVSSARNMKGMFSNSSFNGDISKWDVSKVETMEDMFHGAAFNQDISDWKVSKVKQMDGMFAFSRFNQDLSKWDWSGVLRTVGMFEEADFMQDVSAWRLRDDVVAAGMFIGSSIKTVPVLSIKWLESAIKAAASENEEGATQRSVFGFNLMTNSSWRGLMFGTLWAKEVFGHADVSDAIFLEWIKSQFHEHQLNEKWGDPMARSGLSSKKRL